MEISIKDFGKLSETIIQEYTLTNRQGVSLSAITYGAAVTSIQTQTRMVFFKILY